MTIYCGTICFQFYPVCNFGKFIIFELGNVRVKGLRNNRRIHILSHNDSVLSDVRQTRYKKSFLALVNFLAH